ncbi:MAG: hypothetical protein FJY82_04790 [Candidatus Aminicenantes bacterium]|nr:hypothetical protein [Candidatus Aminicenantes bacterium]
MIRITSVRKKAELRAFIRFPHRVYKNEPRWVPPLDADIKERLDVRRNPFFEHAARELFLAYRNDEVVGRVAAIIDRNHNAVHGEKVVFFGMYESVDDEAVARALLDAAAAWGRERGQDTLRGPANLSLNDECAFLYDGYDSPPTVMMPYNPPYYHGLMAACGLAKAKDLYAFFMDRNYVVDPRVRGVVERTRSSHPDLVVRSFEAKAWREESEKIKAVYNQGWVKNWGFVPWTDKEMDATVKKLLKLADLRIVVLAEDKGRAVGFAFALPNYNEILVKLKGRLFPFGIIRLLLGRKKIRGVRIVVFGILPDYWKTGLSYLLYEKLLANLLDSSYEWAETSWQLEDNEAVNRFVMSVGGRLYKTYRIYERKIA